MDIAKKRNPISSMLQLGWDAVAQAAWGIIIALSGFALYLAKVIKDLLFKEWKTGRDKIEERLTGLEIDLKKINGVIFFYSETHGGIVNIQAYMQHKFDGQGSILNGIDEEVDRLEKKIETSSNEEKELLNQILNKIK